MAGFINLSLTEGELQAVVLSIMEYRRVLAVSALRDEEATREPAAQVAALLAKIERAIDARLQEAAQ